MDQKARSSPQLVVWLSRHYDEAQNRFWTAVSAAAKKKYMLDPVSAVDKFMKLCSEAIDNPYVKGIARYGNVLYVADLN